MLQPERVQPSKRRSLHAGKLNQLRLSMHNAMQVGLQSIGGIFELQCWISDTVYLLLPGESMLQPERVQPSKCRSLHGGKLNQLRLSMHNAMQVGLQSIGGIFELQCWISDTVYLLLPGESMLQ